MLKPFFVDLEKYPINCIIDCGFCIKNFSFVKLTLIFVELSTGSIAKQFDLGI